MRTVQFYAPESGGVAAERFRDAYRTRAGYVPGYSEAFAFDAVHLLRDAVAAGGFTRAGVKSHLDALVTTGSVVQGVGGSYRIDSRHDGRREMRIVEVRKEGDLVVTRYGID